MPRKDKVIHISNLPSTFRGNITRNGRNLPQKQYAVGGKIPNVVAGGIAQPLGNNFFYMNGRKHSQGGIDIGPSDKTGIEVEDGEVVETNGNELKVYSAQPIINGISPARLVMGGANPNKVFQAQENFKDRNGINDDGTKAQYGITKEGEGLFDKIDNYADIAEKTLAIPNMATSTATLLAPNPYTAVASYITGLGGAAIDVYQLSRALYKKDYPNVVKNAIDIGTSIIGLRALRNAKKLRELDKVLRTSGADREIVHKTIGRTTKTKRTIYMTKEANKASNYEAVGYTAIPFSSALNLADTDDANNKKKLGGKNMIVNISGNVKNGLIHSPSSTGGLRDKFAVGGTRINRHGSTWEYDEQIGAYVPITNRTISRTSAYPINKSARGETIVDSDYTFRNGKWSKNSIINNNVNNNTNKSNIDNGNRRPQYYAERRLPLFEDGAGITSGLVRAGWSHGNNKGVSINNTNIPSLSATKSSGKTPRRGRSKSNQSTQSIPTKTPPIAVYNRNLPKVEANIPTTLPVSTSTPAKGTTSSDGKGQGKFKNITAADWIGLGSNMAGSLASYFASRRAINKMRGPGQPTLISANKLKTKYNINPQLDRIREDKFEAYRDIDSNTASSRVSLARKQRVRNAAGQAANELYGNKENIETNLINQDRRNQQSVRQFNAQQYNQYIDRKAAFDNGIREAKVTNINNLFSGINAGIQDMISRYENRKALNNTISAMIASAPNVDDRIMRDAGVDYDEFIIRKRRKLGGKQSCR